MNERNCFIAFAMFCVTTVISILLIRGMRIKPGARWFDGGRDALAAWSAAKGFKGHLGVVGLITSQIMKGGALGSTAIIIMALAGGLNSVCNFMQLPQVLDSLGRMLHTLFDFVLRLLGFVGKVAFPLP